MWILAYFLSCLGIGIGVMLMVQSLYGINKTRFYFGIILITAIPLAAMIQMLIFILFSVFAIVSMVAAWRAYGMPKILYSVGVLLIIAFPLFILVPWFIHYGGIHAYDQPDGLVWIVFIACITGFCGAIVNIIMGLRQLKNKSLPI